jgi:2-polyprenyl-3-methyl-5-hydroxy-6-metoxy-1,4-benzoquinol methylase
MNAARWNHNFEYHDLMLRAMPSPCRAALDVGCGDGTLLRKLAERAETVTGIDISAAMVGRARLEISNPRVELVHDDVLRHDFAGRQFDFITCVATIHHMDFRAAIGRMASLLRRNGTLAIAGLARRSTPKDFVFDAAGLVAGRLEGMRRTLHDPGAPLVDPVMTYTEVERAASDALPGARFRRLLLFRYLLTWTKPA